MAVETEFLQQIGEHPDDVMCRLVYADWLEERGDPRGEFIRLQCAREEMGECPQAGPLRLRLRELLRQHRQEWIGPLSRSDAHVKFRGGLIDEAVVSAWAFNRLFDDLQRRAPVLQRLRFSTASHAHLGEAINRLIASPLADNLRGLDLSSSGANNQHIKRLAQSARLRRLTSLILAWNPIGEDGIRLLSRAGNFARLEVLDLRGVSLRRKAVKMLMEPDRLLDLRLLMISGDHHQAAQRSPRDLQSAYGERLMIC